MQTDGLVFTSLQVSFLYGFAARACRPQQPDVTMPRLKDPSRDDLDVWTPIYRLPHGIHYFDRIRTLAAALPDALVVRPPSGWGTRDNLVVQPQTEASLRSDGFGCMTLAFKCVADDRMFTVEDLLSLLLLPPRRLELGSNDEAGSERAALLMPGQSGDLVSLARWLEQDSTAVSDIFQLFNTIFNNFLSSGFTEPVLWQDYEEQGLYGSQPLKTDPQIPYAFVEAAVPRYIYESAFLEDRRNLAQLRRERTKYSKDIAAILGRWLTPKNIPHASLDYWEAQGLIRNGAFRNLYMNSLSFVTFSGQVTLVLRPEGSKQPRDNAELPQLPARNSLLRCLEIARTRWHHALWLNHSLDRFIADVLSEQDSTRKLLRHFSRLRDLKKSIALDLEDPLVYLWDATLGSQIAEYLRRNVIESLEKAVFRKLALVKDILLDRLDEAKCRDFADIVDRQIPAP